MRRHGKEKGDSVSYHVSSHTNISKRIHITRNTIPYIRLEHRLYQVLTRVVKQLNYHQPENTLKYPLVVVRLIMRLTR